MVYVLPAPFLFRRICNPAVTSIHNAFRRIHNPAVIIFVDYRSFFTKLIIRGIANPP